MRTEYKMNLMEETQKSITNVSYFKSYPILKKLRIKQLDKEILEYMLGWQYSTGNDFFISYKKIAEVLISKEFLIRKSVNFLIDREYIEVVITDNKRMLRVNDKRITETIKMINLEETLEKRNKIKKNSTFTK